jgi:hypothetical protein
MLSNAQSAIANAQILRNKLVVATSAQGQWEMLLHRGAGKPRPKRNRQRSRGGRPADQSTHGPVAISLPLSSTYTPPPFWAIKGKFNKIRMTQRLKNKLATT